MKNSAFNTAENVFYSYFCHSTQYSSEIMIFRVLAEVSGVDVLTKFCQCGHPVNLLLGPTNPAAVVERSKINASSFP